MQPLGQQPQGFRTCAKNIGIKDTTLDLTVIASEVPAAAAALFTQNRFCGAAIVVGREQVADGQLQAFLTLHGGSSPMGSRDRRGRALGGTDASPTGTALRDGGVPAEPFWWQRNDRCIRSPGERSNNETAAGTRVPHHGARSKGSRRNTPAPCR
jgi:hypothetical protein